MKISEEIEDKLRQMIAEEMRVQEVSGNQLEKLTGLSRKSIHSWLTGNQKTITLQSMIKMCEALKIDKIILEN